MAAQIRFSNKRTLTSRREREEAKEGAKMRKDTRDATLETQRVIRVNAPVKWRSLALMNRLALPISLCKCNEMHSSIYGDCGNGLVHAPEPLVP